MTCPPADVLAAFTSGELTDDEVAVLELHLDRCASCLGAVGLMAQSAGRIGGFIDLDPGAMVGRYQILARIGRGAFGVVYAAYDPQLDRKVALKLLRRREPADEERFLRETRALARVSSPHVVVVHDVGRIESGLFAAMEFVDGQTLGDWLREGARTPREIVAAFAQAGRGLGAAHAAGIVHRDFKPDNVLVHRSGHVVVTDFGLARYTAVSPEGDEREPAAAGWLGALTVDGTLAGTPIYMSPEALRRGTVDARSDLFSFCVVLYDALYGAHPFPATTVPELLAAFAREPQPPRESRVPGHVRDAVLSGLRADPDRRPQTMAALVRALEHHPRRTRIAVAALGVTVVALAAARVATVHSEPPDACRTRADAIIDSVWGPARRATVHIAIEGSRSPLAADASARIDTALDRYAGAWRTGWTAACEVGAAHAMAPDLLARRMACLERRRAQWASLVSTLEHPDAIAVVGASAAGYALPNVEVCADERWLAGFSSPQQDAGLVTAYASVTRAQVLSDLGATAAGLEGITAPLAIARKSGDRALEAEALIVEGDLRRAVDPHAAEAPLHAAAIAASAAGRLDLEARAKVLLVKTLAHSQLKLSESELAADYAEAAVTRLGDPELVADYLYARSLAAWSAGGAERSIPIERLALLTSILVRGVDHPQVAEAENAVAVSLVELEQVGASLPLQRDALMIRERLQGPDHPEALNARGNLAYALAELGQIDEAVRLQERVAAGRVRVLGADYFLLSETWVRLSMLYQWELGRWADASRAARRAREIDEHEFGTDAPEGLASLSNLARVLAAQGDLVEAELASRHAMTIAAASLPAQHLLVRTALATRGYVLEQLGRCPEAREVIEQLDRASAGPRSGRRELVFGLSALARCQARGREPQLAEASLHRALEIAEQARGSDSPILADTLVELAQLYLRTARIPEARAAAMRAVDLRAKIPGLVQARARFVLAQAQWSSDPSAARTQAELAAALLRGMGDLPLRHEVERWSSDHTLQPAAARSGAAPTPEQQR